MTIPYSSESLPHVFKLKGLKHAGGRRIMDPESEIAEPDIGTSTVDNLEGTGNDTEQGTYSEKPILPLFSNFKPFSQNEPQSDMGGELTPQSYDVRANSVLAENPAEATVESPQEKPSIWSRIGKALSDYVNPEKKAEVQANLKATQEKFKEPIVNPFTQEEKPSGLTPPESSPGVWGAVKDYFSPTKRSEMQEYNKDLLEDAKVRFEGGDPEEIRKEKEQQFTQEIEKAMENPWEYSVYGASDEIANSPNLQAQFKEITGIDYEPQIAEQVSEHEAAMDAIEKEYRGIQSHLTANEESIKQRILNNQSTDSDKFYIGLALAIPLLIGGFFGADVGLGALGGGSKGVADVLANREKGIREDEASLLDISKQKAMNEERLAGLNLERAKIRPNLIKNLPENANEHLLGMSEVSFIDPKTGEQKVGIQLMPGIIAKPEYIRTKEGLKNMQKSASDLADVKTYVNEINDLTNDVISIVSQLKDKSALTKYFTAVLSGKAPGSISKLTQDIEYQGRKVNAGVLLEEKLGFLANAYGMAKDLGQLDRAAQNHIKKIIDNPTTTLITPEDSLNQMLEIRKLAQRGLIRSAENRGFYPEFIMQDLAGENRELNRGLDKKEMNKRKEEIKRNLLKDEREHGK